MKLELKINQPEIRDAIRQYVESKTSLKVVPNGISLNFVRAVDQRETDILSATVTCEGKL